MSEPDICYNCHDSQSNHQTDHKGKTYCIARHYDPSHGASNSCGCTKFVSRNEKIKLEELAKLRQLKERYPDQDPLAALAKIDIAKALKDPQIQARLQQMAEEWRKEDMKPRTGGIISSCPHCPHCNPKIGEGSTRNGMI